MADEAHSIDAERAQEPVQRLGEEGGGVRAPGLAGAAEAGQVEGDDPAVSRELGNVVAPRLGESPQAVDEDDSRALPLLDIVEEQTVELATRELDLGHVRRRADGTAAHGTGRG